MNAESIGRLRCGVVLVEGGRLAAIERHRDRQTYHLFPGGGCEDGESPPEAAAREALEELGLRVRIGELLAEIRFGDSLQLYFRAAAAGGSFGTGTGPEMAHTDLSPGGTHRAVWLELSRLCEFDLRPHLLRDHLSEGVLDALARRPLRARET